MRMTALLVSAVLGLGTVTVLAADHAEHPMKSDAATTQPSATQPAAKAVNTKCPVTGEDVDPSVATTVYKGKTIGFCCDDCIADFKKDPEKYMKNLK
jgi:YHS domain-containing protein